MKKLQRKSRLLLEFSFSSLLLVSLLLHLIILSVLLKNGYFAHNRDSLASINPFESQASLKPKKSEFGTFVFFDATQEAAPADNQNPPVPDTSPDDASEDQEDTEDSPEPPAEQPVEIPSQEQLPVAVVAQQETTISDEAISKRIAEIEKNQARLTSLQEQKQRSTDQIEHADNADSTEDISKTIFKKHDKQNLSKKEAQPKKRNLIAMTKGFLENLKDEGNDNLERKGDDSKRPTLEELKYLSYEEKINWQLQSSWKRNFAYNLTKIVEGKAVVDFTIDESGQLVSANILQSSGNKELDQLIIKNIEQAAPFPPLPKHFNMKNYASGRIIYVSAQRFGF